MKTALAVAGIVFLSVRGSSAHRLDEYLQATTLSIGKDRVEAEIHLTPGVAVLPFVIAGIDTNGDGVISTSEQRAYAERVLHDLSLAVDGERLGLRLMSNKFPAMQEMQEGLGDIRIEFVADVPGAGRERKLIFENHHQSRIAAYLVNCLVPRDPEVRVTHQDRDYSQSHYELDYSQSAVRTRPVSFAWWSSGQAWIGWAGVLLLTRLAFLWRQRLVQAYPLASTFITKRRTR